MTAIVFDTTAVSHFARATRLGTLATLTAGYERLIPNEVAVELQQGTASYPAIVDGLNCSWITIVELDFPAVVHAATLKAELGGSPTQHLGECAVLAWVKQQGGVAIVDDAAAVTMARHHNVPVRGTLSLIVLGQQRGRAGPPDGGKVGGRTRRDRYARTDRRQRPLRLGVRGRIAAVVRWRRPHTSDPTAPTTARSRPRTSTSRPNSGR